MDYFQFLPLEITLDILARLPPESVLESKLVCTNWRGVVSHPSFSKIHSHNFNHPSADDDSGTLGFLALTDDQKFYYFEYNDNHHDMSRIRRINFTPPFESTSFVGSYNGLICLDGNPSVWICNVITREYVVLPEIIRKESCDFEPYHIHGICSFGFVSSTNEYKVLRIYLQKQNSLEIHIYTLGSGDGWRNLGNCSAKFSICDYNWGVPGMFASGALYWLDDELKMIANFDLAEEKFGEHLSPPPLPQEDTWYSCTIGVFDGFLVFGIPPNIEVAECYDIWIRKKTYDNHDMKERGEHQSWVWSKEFTVDSRTGLLAVTKSDGILICNGNCLFVHDTKASTLKMLVEFKERIREVIPHKNTLISLKELGEEDTKTMESIEMEATESHD